MASPIQLPRMVDLTFSSIVPGLFDKHPATVEGKQAIAMTAAFSKYNLRPSGVIT